ncbi:hypothetical protein MANES_08G120011v8 [Manihot esculenta]|uniref:Uncharacterized protein n=2 Tax=Manihot esculenta TaxID=3983 RepID=A0ACB7HCK0_MANES|nr:hypothetical protein MANES_08G120011v8 [Manihot esculenta]
MIQNSGLQGLKLSRSKPTLTHLLFVDDSVIYAKATSREVEKIKDILHSYASKSGQTINLAKSSLCFSPNTPSDVIRSISSILHINKLDVPNKFLGLPSDIPKSKRQIFCLCKERIANKTASWKEQLLSKGGKEVLSN